MQERKINFYSDGLKLDGSVYLPDSATGKLPTLVVCSGYLGLNAIYPLLFAQAMTQRGYAVIGFDYRGTGHSEGTFGRIVIEDQLRDIQHTISFAKQQPEVDAERIGLIGWGMGAGNVVQVAARDSRVKAVAALNGFYNGRRFLAERNPEGIAEIEKKVEVDRQQRVQTGKGRFGDAYEVYPLDPDTDDVVTERLVPVDKFGPFPMSFELAESLLEMNAENVVAQIAPRPLFIGHGKANKLHVPSESQSLFDKAGEGKSLHWIEGKHNDFMHIDSPVFQQLADDLDQFFKSALSAPVTAR